MSVVNANQCTRCNMFVSPEAEECPCCEAADEATEEDHVSETVECPRCTMFVALECYILTKKTLPC